MNYILGEATGLQPGSLAEWVSGIATSLAFFLGLGILWRDRRHRERQQAERILCRVIPDGYLSDLHPFLGRLTIHSPPEVVIELYNNSDFPINHVMLEVSPESRWRIRRLIRLNLAGLDREQVDRDRRSDIRFEFSNLIHGVLEGRSHLVATFPLDNPALAYRYYFRFVDHSGITWFTNLQSGRQHRLGRVEAKNRGRGLGWEWRYSVTQRLGRFLARFEMFVKPEEKEAYLDQMEDRKNARKRLSYRDISPEEKSVAESSDLD